MNPLILLAGKPIAGFLAGVTLFGFSVRQAEVEAVDAEIARLRAEVEALEADLEADLELEVVPRERLLVPEELDEARKKLVAPDELEDARKQLRKREDAPER